MERIKGFHVFLSTFRLPKPRSKFVSPLPFPNSELMIDVPKSCRQGMCTIRRYCGEFQQVAESKIYFPSSAFVLKLGKPSTSLSVLDGGEYQIHATSRGEV
jgi:hypothetical protein